VGAPDLVVEVISPSSVRTDRVIKFTAYEAAGISEYWVANPHTRTREVYTLSKAAYDLWVNLPVRIKLVLVYWKELILSSARGLDSYEFVDNHNVGAMLVALPIK